MVGAQLNFRTVSVAERLKQSPGQEAAFFTGQNRSDVTQTVLAVLPSSMVDDLAVDAIDPATGNKQTVTLGDIRKGTTPIDHLQIPPIKQDTDEAALFSSGVQLLEQHIALLRQLEGRVAQFNKVITLSEQTLSAIHTHLNDIDAALKTVEDAVSNARHAYTFTKALLQDEQTRVAGVNARRAAVLQNSVPFVVFRRPVYAGSCQFRAVAAIVLRYFEYPAARMPEPHRACSAGVAPDGEPAAARSRELAAVYPQFPAKVRAA